MMAHRKIKANHGSKTKGMDKQNVIDFKNMVTEEYLSEIKLELLDYKSGLIRRKEIPKPNGGVRPLGISCYKDKIIEEAIKQVIEPIVEAKFHPDSYGFRPGRSAQEAIQMSQTLVRAGYTYACEFDIKKCFDNIKHRLIRKKLWALGIRDTRLLTIISKRLRANIYDPKTKTVSQSTLGTVQGGVLSPLLANVVLNSLDWWIASQWERFDFGIEENDYKNYASFHAAMNYRLNKTRLKSGRIVRYADDFVIFCKTEMEAKAWYFAVKDWMKCNLKLEISEEKSRIVDLTKDSIDFLGFELKANKEGKKCVKSVDRSNRGSYKYTKTSVTTKNLNKIIQTLKTKIKIILKTSDKKAKAVLITLLNITILGYHNYWRIASESSINFYNIYQRTKLSWWKLRRQADSKTHISPAFRKLYKEYVDSAFSIDGNTIYPIWGCRHTTLNPKKRDYNWYEDSPSIPENISSQMKIMCCNPIIHRSVEYNDNRLSKYSMQLGKDYITGKFVMAQDVHCHHKTMVSKGGKDNFDNLVILSKVTHGWVHQVNPEIPYMTKVQMDRLNDLREKCGREPLKNKKKSLKSEN
jgi:group II intron reverse transcriptase/maturase